MMKKWIVRAVTGLVLAVAVFMAYMTAYEYVIYFHEQHYLFRFTTAYWNHAVNQRGIWWPLTEFIVQFGYWPWLGALLWTGMIVGVYAMTGSIIRRLTGWRDIVGVSLFLPVWMFFRTVQVDVLPVNALKTFVIVLVVWILSLLASRFIPPIRKRYEASKDPTKEKCRIWWIGVMMAAMALCWTINYHMFTSPITMTLKDGKTRTFSREDRQQQRAIEAQMIKAERALKRADWKEVYELTTDQALTGKKNHLMSYFRAMALFHLGMFPDHLLDFPQQFGVNTLYFPWKADKNQAEYGGYIYEQLGAINSANHWEFEALVGWGETPAHLTNLARYAILSGKPQQAERFINALDQTLFYRGTAKELRRQLAEGKVEGLRDALANAKQEHPRWDNVLNLNGDTRYILEFDPDNAMAREYLLTGLLLANNIGAFWRNLQDFYKPDMPMPRVYQEALCLVRMQLGSEVIDAAGFKISPEVDQAFRKYLESRQKNNFNLEQKRSYWYYTQYVNPHTKELIF